MTELWTGFIWGVLVGLLVFASIEYDRRREEKLKDELIEKIVKRVWEGPDKQ